MKSGDSVSNVSTNAELINKLFGTNHSALMKAAYTINSDTFVWMVYLDGVIRQDWKNIRQGDTIIEQYCGKLSKPPKNFGQGMQSTKRIVFEKIKSGKTQYYVFRGVYKLYRVENNNTRRILVKIADEYHF